ncbi:hypothetical protein AAVH_29378 [Aphelenchoides avenae]|nr:hypothetical protein AAVH_29378 [Aphelenchus avenae]
MSFVRRISPSGKNARSGPEKRTSLKGEKAALEVAHKQAFSVQRKKLMEANAALVTAYQDAEGLRRELADAKAENAAYRELFAKGLNVGKEVNTGASFVGRRS